MKKRFITVFAIIFMIVLLSACGKTTYEIDKEVSIEFEGYDEYGQVIVSLDREALFNALDEKMELKESQEVTEFESIIYNLTVQATPNENLENGDEVELELQYEEENSINLELKLKDAKITVEELEPITTLSQEDIFSGMELEFEGVSPLLKARILDNPSSEVAELFNYTIAEKRFTNDEEIEIIAEPQSDLTSLGYKADEKDFTHKINVPKHDKYVENWDELNDEDKEYILGEIGDTVTAKVDAVIQDRGHSVSNKGNYVATGGSIAASGKSNREEQYFLYLKGQEFDEYSNDKPNSVRFVFENEITFGEDIFLNDDYANKTKDLFSIVGAENLIIDENGDLVRSELNVQTFGNPDLNKETVKNESIDKVKDMFTVEKFEIDSED